MKLVWVHFQTFIFHKLIKSIFLILDNIGRVVNRTHMNTWCVFIAAPPIPVINGAEKASVGNLQIYFKYMYRFTQSLDLIFYSQVDLKSLTFTKVPLEKDYWLWYNVLLFYISHIIPYFIQEIPAAFILLTLQL